MKIKICGIKNENEATDVLKLDIDFIGVIFAPSKRKITQTTAAKIIQIAHNYNKKCVGVFAQMPESEILNVCKNTNLDIAQIYGNYSLTLKEKLNLECIEVWKAHSIQNKIPDLQKNFFDKALFDCKGKNLGGNGVSFDWNLLKSINNVSFILAGGIGYHNILKAIKFNPYAIDLNSLVEDSAGNKDPKKIERILNIIKK